MIWGMDKVKCRECKKPFDAAVFWARYCGRKCKNKANMREWRAAQKAKLKAV
jgi:hypothetical protein